MAAESPLPTLLQTSPPSQLQKQKPSAEAGAAAFDENPTTPLAYAESWAQAVQRFGAKKALIFDGIGPERCFTYLDLESGSNRLARNLGLRCGVEAGHLVVTLADNCPDMVMLLLACVKLGAVFVPLSVELRVPDCQSVVALYQPKLIVCDGSKFASSNLLALTPLLIGLDALHELVAQGSAMPLKQGAPPASEDDEPSIIFSTSGSTGLPKGVMYSRATLASIATPRNTALADHFASAAGDVALFWISMRGVGGTVLLLVQLIKGVTHIMVDSSPSGPSQWGPLIDKHKVNSFLLFGAAMNQFLQEMPTRCFNSVKQVCYGGSCFAAGLVRCSMKQFPNATFTQIYGLTEVFPISMLGHQHHTPEDKATVADNFRMASAGKPLGQGVFIEDLDLPGSGKPPPPEKDGVGQICAVAETVMMGYYKDPEKTREAMPDNKFVRTGDIGKIDQDGFLHIVGRIKDIIPSYGGFNVAPRDVEEVLYMHPSVGQAAVVGVYHPSGAGEAVVAWTTARAGAELTASALRRHCQEAGLPSWQMPDAIHVSSSPLPTVGSKIARQTLQGAEFRQRALLEDLSRARHRVLAGPEEDVQEQQHHPFNATCPAAAGEVSDEGGEAKVHNLSAFSASDAALFAQLLGGTAPLGDQLVLEARGLQLAGWLRLLEAMPREEHSAFLLQATSLLKQGKSFSCEGAP